MSRSITPEQQQELQQLQQLSQQLTVMNQNYIQMETRKRELERTIDVMKDMEDETEIYRSAGQILFRTDVNETKNDLKEQLELLEVRVPQSKKQIEELDKRVKDGEAKLRASIT
ncbi:MAG: prefoldin subunit [Candidatus Kariarchaeaceae archaeon]|jgi:prefoldin beta subunit